MEKSIYPRLLSAFPCDREQHISGRDGLTKREYAAIQIMAGYAANPQMHIEAHRDEQRAEWAVKEVDALFAELAK